MYSTAILDQVNLFPRTLMRILRFPRPLPPHFNENPPEKSGNRGPSPTTAGIICSSKPAVSLKLRSQKTVRFEEHIKSNGAYCVYYPSNIFRKGRSFENWGIFSDIPQFKLGNTGHVTRLDQSYASQNI